MSWLEVKGKRGEWTKAKEGENYHGWHNKENEKPLETLFGLKGEEATNKFFTPAPKKW